MEPRVVHRSVRCAATRGTCAGQGAGACGVEPRVVLHQAGRCVVTRGTWVPSWQPQRTWLQPRVAYELDPGAPKRPPIRRFVKNLPGSPLAVPFDRKNFRYSDMKAFFIALARPTVAAQALASPPNCTTATRGRVIRRCHTWPV